MTYDFAPLFLCTAIGFDRPARLVDTLPQDATGYPPYNIEKTGEVLLSSHACGRRLRRQRY